MSTLEVLQSCPTQRKNLLTALGALDPDNTKLIHFNVENYKPRLPHKLTFHINTKLVGNKVFRMVLDEGASTLVLSLTCWKALGSPEIFDLPLKPLMDGVSNPMVSYQPSQLSWGKKPFPSK